MTQIFPIHVFSCNGATGPQPASLAQGDYLHHLEYRVNQPNPQSIKISLPAFVKSVTHLPSRVLDLLEIAAYVFSADRSVSRGRPDAVEYQCWERSFHFHVKVRDVQFWQSPTVRDSLSEALCFMSGDREYSFTFEGGHKTGPTSLFDDAKFSIQGSEPPIVTLFSGGLDSLTGVLYLLRKSPKPVCLVSHQSQPSIVRTQGKLVDALSRMFPQRVHHYRYECCLKDFRAVDENQRTRAFLFAAIAYAISHGNSQNKLFAFENGVTALNFPKRQDMMNARASRTMHPKTIALLKRLLSLVEDASFDIETPFGWKTKTDVMVTLQELGGSDLLTSSVSCSKTFQRLEMATHCGGCSQCVDRRFAAYAAGMEQLDNCGLYAHDFIQDDIADGAARSMVVDYVRQAHDFATENVDCFCSSRMVELSDIAEAMPEIPHTEVMEKVWQLCRRHGQQVFTAIGRIRQLHDDPHKELPKGSFLYMLASREYLKIPAQRLVEDVCRRLDTAIPIAFQRNPPKDEKDFNDKVSAILSAEKPRLDREHPHVSFACGHAVPDHSSQSPDVFIESKYIRGGTTPGKVSEGVAADLTKYKGCCVLFILFDPQRAITDREKFKKDFETKGNCAVHIIS